MKKIISIILLCSLLLVCFSGCSISDVDDVNGTTSGEDGTTTGEDGTTSNNEINSTPEDKELSEFFEIIRSDAESEEKLEFSVVYEQIYYELKNSGEFDNSEWERSTIFVAVSCNYERAVNEDWYKQCSATDIESLNQAFYDAYGLYVPNGEYYHILLAPGMHLIYSSIDDFYSDYSAMKAIVDLEYVEKVRIVYNFGLPRGFVVE